MTLFSDERGAELRQLFFESAQELLQTLNEEALKLEQHPGDAEVVRSIRRVVHTLKGDAAACGFRELSDSAHELEDALAIEILSKEVSLVELAFTAADSFEAMLSAYQNNVAPPDVAPLRRMIGELISTPQRKSPAENAKAVVELPVSEAEQLLIQNARARGKLVYMVTTQIDPGCAMPIAAHQLVVTTLQTLGEILTERESGGPGPGFSSCSQRNTHRNTSPRNAAFLP